MKPRKIAKRVIKEKAIEATKASMPPTRTLNSDLNDVPPSGYIKFTKDWRLYSDYFW